MLPESLSFTERHGDNNRANGKPNRDTGRCRPAFPTNNLIVAPGTPPGVVAGGSSSTQDSPSPPTDAFSPLEEEQTLWEGRYSARNFLGRVVGGGMLLLAGIALALATWGFGYPDLAWLTYAAFVGVSRIG